MALKVGELYGTLRLDSSQFDRGLDQSGQRLGGLQRAIGAGAKAAATMFAGAVTAVGALGVSALKVGLSYNRMQQSSRAALNTLLGGAEAANAQMDKLDEFASTSPFAKDVFIRAQQQMIGFGIETEKVIPYLDSIQNAVAAVGGSNEDISELTRIFSQIQSSAKITAEDLNQFGERGVNAAELIGSQMEMTGAEVREAITGGTLDAGEALDALAAGMGERFGGATDLIKQQFDGAADRVKAAFRDIGGIIAAPFIDPQGGGRAVEWTNQVADAMRALQEKVGPTVDILMQRFAPAIDAISPMLVSAKEAINSIDLSQLNGQLDSLSKYTPLIAGAGAALFAFGTTNLPILSALGISGINPVVAGLAALAATSPEVRAAGGQVLSSLEPLVPMLAALGIDLANVGVQILQELVPALGDLLAAGGTAAVALAGTLAPAVVDLVSAGTPLVSLLAEVVGWVSDLPTPVLAAGLAFAALNGPMRSLGPLVSGLGQSFMQFRDMARVQASLGGVGAASGAMGAAMVGAQAGIRAVGTALKTAFLTNPIGLAITGITTAISLFAGAQAEARQHAEALRGTLDELGRATDDTARKIAESFITGDNGDWGWFQRVRTGFDSAADAMDGLGISIEDATSAVTGSRAGFDAYIDQLTAMREEMGSSKMGTALYEVIVKLQQQRSALEESQHASGQLTGALGENRDATDEAANSSQEYTDELLAQRDAQDEAADSALSLAEANQRQEEQTDRTADAIDEYNDMVESGEASNDELAAAQRRMERELLSNVRAYGNTRDAMRRNNATGMELRNTVREQRSEFIRTARQMGYTAQEARDLADEYGLIPDSVETIIRAETANAQRAVNSFIRTNNGRTIYVRVEGREISYGNSRSAGSATGPMRYEAQGDVLSYFAEGGMSPMAATLARIVPANTKRVIGDRASGDEAFIPLVPGNQRSVALWEEAGRRLGTLTAYMADGGITAPRPSQAPIPAQGGMHVENVHVTTASSGFSLEQVRERLRMAGAS